jgi:hypothetical protein
MPTEVLASEVNFLFIYHILHIDQVACSFTPHIVGHFHDLRKLIVFSVESENRWRGGMCFLGTTIFVDKLLTMHLFLSMGGD